jgi:hypothetical protein
MPMPQRGEGPKEEVILESFPKEIRAHAFCEGISSIGVADHSVTSVPMAVATVPTTARGLSIRIKHRHDHEPFFSPPRALGDCREFLKKVGKPALNFAIIIVLVIGRYCPRLTV